jgi:2-phosphosulfolactate phosphatase
LAGSRVKLQVVFTPAEVAQAELAGRVVIVLDVLRATTTIVEALANGARRVLPVATVDEAAVLAQKLDRSTTLLCGERHCRLIEGFDLGNSPAEFTSARVRGKSLIMSTTNGTVALLAASSAHRVIVGSFLNFSAVIETVVQDGADCTILCAGRERRFAMEDAVCAGMLARRLRERVAGTTRRNDGAVAAMALARRYGGSIVRMFRATSAGRHIIEAGLADDLVYCAELDRHTIVPELKDREVSA